MPKWITGTDGSSRAKSLAMCGWTNRTIVARAERADPAIEDLECLAPAVGLRVQVKRGRLGQTMHEGVPGTGVAIHERLGLLVVPRSPPSMA